MAQCWNQESQKPEFNWNHPSNIRKTLHFSAEYTEYSDAFIGFAVDSKILFSYSLSVVSCSVAALSDGDIPIFHVLFFSFSCVRLCISLKILHCCWDFSLHFQCVVCVFFFICFSCVLLNVPSLAFCCLHVSLVRFSCTRYSDSNSYQLLCVKTTAVLHVCVYPHIQIGCACSCA